MTKAEKREEIVDTLAKMSAEGGYMDYFCDYTSPDSLNIKIFPQSFINAAMQISRVNSTMWEEIEKLKKQYKIDDSEVEY